MSSSRQSAIAIELFTLRSGEEFDRHRHDTHQLAWTPEGVLRISVEGRSWVLPPSLALWIPAGTWHVSAAVRTAVLHGIYLTRSAATDRWAEPTVVSATPALRAMIEHLSGDLSPEARARAEAVVPDLLTSVETLTIDVPVPTDPRAAQIAAALAQDPLDDRDLQAWGRAVGASERTLSRIFARETGLGFPQWRTRLRLRVAFGLLADGASVSQAGRRVGYSSASAFVASFRRVTGQTPGEYFELVRPAGHGDVG